jgi:hypothetical protein
MPPENEINATCIIINLIIKVKKNMRCDLDSYFSLIIPRNTSQIVMELLLVLVFLLYGCLINFFFSSNSKCKRRAHMLDLSRDCKASNPIYTHQNGFHFPEWHMLYKDDISSALQPFSLLLFQVQQRLQNITSFSFSLGTSVKAFMWKLSHVKAKSLCSLFEATKSLAPQPQVNEWLAKVTGNLFQFQDQEQKRTEELPSP